MMVMVNALSAVSGGAVSYVRNILPRLYDLFKASGGKHRLRILVHESQLDLFPGIPASECRILPGPRPAGYKRAWWEFRNIPCIAQEEQADVLFHPYQIGRRVSGIRNVLMMRNMEPFYFGRYRYGANRWVRNYLLGFDSRRSLAGADRVIAVSGFAEDFLLQSMRISPTRVYRIYHGCDVSSSPDDNTTHDGELLAGLGISGDFILTCGSLLPYRRCEDVIRAFGRLDPAKRGRLSLVIAGSGSDQRYSRLLRREIAASGVAGRILQTGHVPREIMQALYRRCQACVIASEVEACPNIAIEAMGHGCVIVASDSPPLPEMFAGAAAHFPSRDITALAGIIQRGLTDRDLRLRLSERARSRAQDFSWEKCARETYSALVNW